VIRVLVADDHWGFRFGMRALLASEPDTELVAEATTGDEAVDAARTLTPDVVLMDLNMPGRGGIEATRDIVTHDAEIAVLVLTMVEDDDSVFAAMRAGARGYVLKGADGIETMRAVRAVASGDAIFSPDIARRMRRYFGATGATQPFPELTEREREILALVAQGLTNTAVADRLHLSHKTVRNYVSSIFAKLGVSHRGEAVARARDAGLGA
jgi:DNA-binding NarL/FixJ family response regulator